jgi:hypothetical protein
VMITSTPEETFIFPNCLRGKALQQDVIQIRSQTLNWPKTFFSKIFLCWPSCICSQYQNVCRSKMRNSKIVFQQTIVFRVARYFSAQNTKTGKDIPNNHKIFHIATMCTKL